MTPFDWMEPKRNPALAGKSAAKREAMVRGELAERAALLHRLGHSRTAVTARLEGHVRWEADQPGGVATATAADIAAVVDREFGPSAPAPRAKR